MSDFVTWFAVGVIVMIAVTNLFLIFKVCELEARLGVHREWIMKLLRFAKFQAELDNEFEKEFERRERPRPD